MKNIKAVETNALKHNMEWFTHSGVMDPSSGIWGVGERIVLTQDNSALERIKEQFSAFSDYGEYIILEHRRPDCNFETALMFLLTAEVFNDERMSATGDNILHYLFRKSNTRNEKEDNITRCLWKWAANYWWQAYYIDDNSWNGILSIMIGKRYSGLNEKYLLLDKGVETVEIIRKCLQALLDGKKQPEVSGLKLSPHFAALAIMAFAHSWKVSANSDLRLTALQYVERIQEEKKKFTSSEYGYYLMGNACCASAFGDECFYKEAKESADYILSIMSTEGMIPSEYAEAPVGKNLIDTIYTQNWCTIGLHSIWKLTGNSIYREAYERSVNLLARIQDRTPTSHLNGCWRGMYNMEQNTWGGGDLFEGGANSIYTGWTNAPISFVFAMDILGLSLLP